MSRSTPDLFTADRTRWLRLATVLTGDPDEARTLLASAHLRTPPRPDRSEPDVPEPDGTAAADLRADETARQVLFDAFLAHRPGLSRRLGLSRRPAAPPLRATAEMDTEDLDRLDRRAETPDPPPVEPAATPDTSTDDAGTRLGELTRRQRAVLALVCHEELTETEAARVVEETQPVVHGDLASALSALGLPAGRLGYERAGTLLRQLAETAPGPDGLGGEVRRQQAVRRRFRTRVLGAAFGVVVLVVGVSVVPEVVRYRLPVTAREPGEFVLQHRVEPPDGWYPVDRAAGVDADYTLLSGESPAPQSFSYDSLFCSVLTLARGVDPADQQVSAPADGDRVRIHGHRGHVHRARAGGTAVSWEFAPEAWVSVTCSTDVDREHLVDLARQVRFTESAVHVPFRWPEVPADHEIAWVSHLGEKSLVSVEIGYDGATAENPPLAVTLTLERGMNVPDTQDADRVLASTDGEALCRVQDSVALCAHVSQATTEDNGDQPSRSQHPGQEAEVVRALLADLELADFSDPDSWFDAREAFGS